MLNRVQCITDSEVFKKKNKEHWLENTKYWTENELRQVVDTKDFLKSKILELFYEFDEGYIPIVYDFGFGNCWLLELLMELNLKFKYIGFDFNDKFIYMYSKKYSKNNNISFIKQDLEVPLKEEFLDKADIVFTLFTLFEIPLLDKVFKNINNSLKEEGKNILLTIDSFYLILALSSNFEELKSLLTVYDNFKNDKKVPYFFQNIDLGDSVSESLKYASVLHSTADYINISKNNDLVMLDFQEIVKTSKLIPKVYEYYEFQKGQPK